MALSWKPQVLEVDPPDTLVFKGKQVWARRCSANVFFREQWSGLPRKVRMAQSTLDVREIGNCTCASCTHGVTRREYKSTR